MKKFILRMVSFTFLYLIFTFQASAATATANLNITATVKSACNINTTPLTFNEYDSTSLTSDDGTASLSITCTKDTTYAVGLDKGKTGTLNERKMVGSVATNTLNYNLYTDNSRTVIWGDATGTTKTVAGTGTGAVQSLTVYGRIPVGQYAVAGAYTDTVTATITY